MIAVINKKRVLKAPKNIGNHVVLYAPVAGLSQEIQSKYGLDLLKIVGQTITPTGVKTATCRNVEGLVEVHKDLPKTKYCWQQYWEREQWAGNGETETVSDYVTVCRPCYQRTQHEAQNIELQLQANSVDDLFYVTDVLKSEDESRLIIGINMMLEIFGTVFIADAPYGELSVPIKIDRQVGWKMLPKGTRSVEQLKRDLDLVYKSTKKKTAKSLFTNRLEQINKSFKPKTITIGLGGFNGYVAFTFEELGFTILECIHLNNATYVFSENWEITSKLSKTEILGLGLAKERIIHGTHWESRIEALLNQQNAA